MRKLFRLADRDACRHRALLAHFDEEVAPCGDACDVCAGVDVAELAAARTGAGDAVGGRSGGGLSRQGAPGGARSDGDRADGPGGGGGDGRDRDPSDPTFQRLRALRKSLADERDVPAYIVFSDKVLWNMIDRRPTTPDEMLEVSGVGEVKLERYGEAFLRALHVGGEERA